MPQTLNRVTEENLFDLAEEHGWEFTYRGHRFHTLQRGAHEHDVMWERLVIEFGADGRVTLLSGWQEGRELSFQTGKAEAAYRILTQEV